MSRNRFRFTGLEELKAELRNLPEALAQEAQAIVFGMADEAAAEIRAAYPSHTGNLRRGVSVVRRVYAVSTAAIVVNKAPHAFLYENGTQARHYFTKGGVKKALGRMPPGHVFVPIMIRKRRQMYERLKGLLVRHGLSVSGEV